MKTMIYAGIVLFSAASIYGVADYYNSQKNGILDNLYKEEDVPITAPNNHSNSVTSTKSLPDEKPLILPAKMSDDPKKIKQKAKRTIRLEEYSRGRIEEPLPVEQEEIIKPPVVVEETKKPVEAVATPAKVEQTIIPGKKLKFADFSRAKLSSKRPLINNLTAEKRK